MIEQERNKLKRKRENKRIERRERMKDNNEERK